jgi:hypothetical protein
MLIKSMTQKKIDSIIILQVIFGEETARGDFNVRQGGQAQVLLEPVYTKN